MTCKTGLTGRTVKGWDQYKTHEHENNRYKYVGQHVQVHKVFLTTMYLHSKKDC